MSNSPAFVEHVLDLLAPLGNVSARPMFGGHGLYCGGVMFGLLDDGELFLRTDELTLPAFLAAGCKQWTYPSPKGPMPTANYRPPPEALERSEELLPWFTRAMEAARRKAAKKAKKANSAGRAKAAQAGERGKGSAARARGKTSKTRRAAKTPVRKRPRKR